MPIFTHFGQQLAWWIRIPLFMVEFHNKLSLQSLYSTANGKSNHRGRIDLAYKSNHMNILTWFDPNDKLFDRKNEKFGPNWINSWIIIHFIS